MLVELEVLIGSRRLRLDRLNLEKERCYLDA